MTDTVSIREWIEERRDFHRKRWVERESWSEAVRDWQANFPRALNALQAVLELHRPQDFHGVEDGSGTPAVWEICAHCDESYPCATVQAIEGAISG